MRGVAVSLALTALLSTAAAAFAQAASDTNDDPLGLVGRPAPRLDGRLHLGPRVPGVNEMKSKVVLLFFWAHWCLECKAESATVSRLLEKYRSQGLTIIAPTQRYGYGAEGRPTAPDKELRHIVQVRDRDYRFLSQEPVPVGEANSREYGATSIPLHVLIDRQGVVRFYHAGRMTEEELEAAIRRLL
jgi:peroxiredoxin